MEIITSVKFVATKAMRPMVLIATDKHPLLPAGTLRADGRPTTGGVWITQLQWLNAGHSLDVNAYDGGTLHVEFFKKGEKLLNGTEATDDNVIVKAFSAAQNSEVTGTASAIRTERAERQALIAAAKYRSMNPLPAGVAASVAAPEAVGATADLEA